MKKILLAAILLTTPAYADSKIEIRGSVITNDATVIDTSQITKYFATGKKQHQTVTATASTFTAITVPTGSKAIIIDVGTTRGLKLKGVTGDTGISLDSTCPIVIPLSGEASVVTLGLQNQYATDASVDVYFF